jgi:hypothetical protein
MAEPHVISALCTKRAEISGYIADLERKINRQRAVLANVDATIRLFSPGINPTPFRPSGPSGALNISLAMNCPGLRKPRYGPHWGHSRRLK